MKLISVILFVNFAVCASGAVLLESRGCARGPTYWCSHIDRAKQCGAVQHCMTTVWRYQTIQPESTKTCTYCQLVMNELKERLQDKTSEAEIAAILANACEVLHNTDWKDECKGIVKDNLPELIQMLASDMNADMICAAFGLCSGLDSAPGWTPVDKVDANGSCADCVKFFEDVQKTITSNETEAQVEQLVNQAICDRLRSLTDMCKELVHEYLPLVLNLLADQIDPNITCRMFGFCVTNRPMAIQLPHMSNIFKDRPKMALQYRSSEECEICKTFLSSVDDLLRDNITQAKVKAEIESVVCASLGDLSDECVKVVEEYAPLVFELLVNELDPKTVCEAIGLCAVPSMYKAIAPVTSVSATTASSAIPCEVCKAVMTELDVFLTQSTTVAAIGELLEEVCKRLPDQALQTECLMFVRQYEPMIVDLIKMELDPSAICAAIGLCSGRVQMKSTKTSPVCTVCELVIGEMQKLLQNISSQDVTNEFLSLCTDVPKAYQGTCTKYVLEYVPMIVGLLHMKVSPKTLCIMATACSDNTTSRLPYLTKPIPEEPVRLQDAPTEICKICDTILMMLREMISDNATRAEIEQEMDQLCGVLPTVFKNPCDLIVKTYGESIILFLLNHTDPYTICKEIGLCKSSQPQAVAAGRLAGIMSPYDVLPLQPVETDTKQVKLSSTSVGGLCTVCELAMKYLEATLEKNATEEEIKAALDTLCSYLPASYSQQCTQLVEEYSQLIIKFLVEGFSPDEICSAIGLCSAASRPPKPSMTSGELCTVCELAMKYLESILEKNATQEEIKAALDTLCSYLPTSYSQQCTQLVEEYSQLIINYIVMGITPDQICSAIGVCSAASQPREPQHVVPLVNDKQVAGGELCSMCEVVVNYIKNFIDTNQTVEEVEKELKVLCKLLPDTVTAQCNDVVDNYVPAILDLIKKGMDPLAICKQIGLCTNNRGTKKLPESYALMKLQPSMARKKVDNTLYFKPDQRRQMLGRKECTYGPAYWCARKENAVKCNAVAHCEEHGWLERTNRVPVY